MTKPPIYDELLHHGEPVKLEKGDPIYDKYKKILEAFGL